jgi:hypothetical protein
VALLTLLAVLLPASLIARTPPPTYRILLEPLGFQPIHSRYLLSGSSMLTLHYVDDTHLLVTFANRRLVHRIPSDPPYHRDHNTDAVLLELPSGRVLARAEWHLHDHGQYLWNLGHGHFLLRISDTFTTFAPLAGLLHGEPFAQRPFLNTTRHVAAAILSSDIGLLTIETTDPIPEVDPQPPIRFQLNFYRLFPPNGPGGHVIPSVAGGAISPRPLELPLNSTGMIDVLDQGKQRWAFDFRSHAGKVDQLSLYDSTCYPIPAFVSPSEFVVFGCHGGTTRQQLAGFNLHGDEMWEQTLYGSYIAPRLEYAPAGGRFALGRVLTNSAAISTDTLDPAMVSGQVVDVYQIDSGKPLFHLDCTPATRAGQNFTLSPDGMNLAIVREGAIEIYSLPALGPKDKAAIKLAQTTAPAANNAPIDLSVLTQSEAHRTGDARATQDAIEAGGQPSDHPSTPVPPPAPSASAPPREPLPAASPSGATAAPDAESTPASTPVPAPAPAPPDADQPPKPRKPPTLYNPPSPDPAQPPEIKPPR